MEKRQKKAFAGALALAMIFAICGCDGGGGSGVGPLPDYDAKINEYSVTIGGWLTPAEINEEQLQYVVDAGVDTLYFFINSYAPTEADYAALALCEAYGINIYITTGGKDGDALSNVTKYNDCNAVVGMTIDEPDKAGLDTIATLVNSYNQNSADKTMFTNLFPSFAKTINNDFSGKYEDYVRYYCDNVMERLTVGEKWLSADRYVLTYNGKGEKSLDTGWLYDLETLATVAKDYDDVKTNFFIQTMPYGEGTNSGSRNRVPTYEDIRMQEYALMAFGYDSISLFCYGTPAVGPEFSEDQVALIDRTGNRTDTYYAAQKANKEILGFDHVIQQFDWIGVFTNDAGKTTTGKDRTSNPSFSNLTGRMSLESVACLEQVTSSADTLFGYFMDGADNEGFVVVNYNETTLGKTDTVEMKFNNEYRYNKCLCYVGGEKKVYDIRNNTLELTLGVGEGVFVVPYCA